jgi:hypothetical protein
MDSKSRQNVMLNLFQHQINQTLKRVQGDKIMFATKSMTGERRAERLLKKFCCLFIILLFGLLGTRCAAPKEELHAHGETGLIKTYPKNYVHPLTEINLEKVIEENRGLKILEENATTVHDYYRGGVQEKAEGEGFLKEGKWEEGQIHFEKSNKFLRVVLKYLSEDEANRNIYGDHVVIFLPNLLMADNYLKLITIYRKIGRDDKIGSALEYGKDYLSFSLKSVRTEWALQIQKGFEEALPKK